MTINPPPTWTTGSEIPKKERMCVPMKYEPTSRKKLFIAIRQDSALRMLGEYSLVIARKMGLPPSGSTIGNSALRIRKRLFDRSEEHTSEFQSRLHLVCRLLLEKKKKQLITRVPIHHTPTTLISLFFF